MIRSVLVSRNAISSPPTPTGLNTSRRLIIGGTRICACCSSKWWKKPRTGSWSSASSPLRQAPCARRNTSFQLVGMALRAVPRICFQGMLRRLGDASLPFGRQQDVRPIFVFRDQSRTNRILQNVMAFFPPTFISAQAMIEKVALPLNFCAPRRKSLPARDEVRHRRIQPETHKKVNMIRHQHHHVHEPPLFALIKPRSLKKNRRNLRMAKLI